MEHKYAAHKLVVRERLADSDISVCTDVNCRPGTHFADTN